MFEPDTGYLRIDKYDTSPSGKTNYYKVINVINDEILGHIKWNGDWGRYCFWPLSNTLYDPSCLNTLAKWLIWATQTQRN